MSENLVDNDLKEQRCDKGEDLQEKRGDENMSERLAVTPDRRQEPVESKCARADTRPADLARQHDHLGLNLLKECIEVEHPICARDGVDHAIEIVRTASAKHGISTRSEANDCRRWNRL